MIDFLLISYNDGAPKKTTNTYRKGWGGGGEGRSQILQKCFALCLRRAAIRWETTGTPTLLYHENSKILQQYEPSCKEIFIRLAERNAKTCILNIKPRIYETNKLQ